MAETPPAGAVSTTASSVRLALPTSTSTPPSPTASRRYHLAGRRGSWTTEDVPDERTGLLYSQRSRVHLQSAAKHPSLSRSQSYVGSMSLRHHSRAGSWSQRLIKGAFSSAGVSSAGGAGGNGGGGGGGGGGVGGDSGGGDALEASILTESKGSLMPDERVWYDQFTSTDWVHDSIADAYRVKALRARKDFWGRVYLLFDSGQGWILSALVGFLVAVLAYVVDVSEAVFFDYKYGYCSRGWRFTEKQCCPHGACTDWREWGEILSGDGPVEMWAEYGAYICAVILLASAACLLTLTTKTVVPSAYRLSTLDENLAAEPVAVPYDDHPDDTHSGSGSSADGDGDGDGSGSGARSAQSSTSGSGRPANAEGPGINEGGYGTTGGALGRAPAPVPAPTPAATPASSMVYYSAAGSGVAEVRVILSGFVLHGFLGFQTLVIKMAGLVLSVASGLSLGKEGPYVHIATCAGNIACRLFSKYDQNDAKRREVLSAAAAAGVTVAFGAPLGGVLFCLEEVAYFFPAKTLFRTFFCCITAALTLKFLNPYGTNKIVLFQVQYAVDWEYFELGFFVAVGVLGGLAGAIFIKASRHWAKSFRGIPLIKAYPLLEVGLVALVTGLVGYWSDLTKLPVAELLYNLAAPCDDTDNNLDSLGICPARREEIPPILLRLLGAFLIKGVLTIVTFGIKVPAGIYVPSMVVGGLLGRLVGHAVQWTVLRYPTWAVWSRCAAAGDGASCIQPGVYGLIAAGATMCGVTRLSVTLAVILFEITGSLDYVLPFSLAILVAKWTADAIEPLSIYDLLTEMNSYPFLHNKHKPNLTSELGDIVPRMRRQRIIDISASPLVRATVLRQKLELLHRAGELDGGLPIVRHDILVGLIPAPDLEFALDNLRDEATSQCLMAPVPTIDDSDDEDAAGRGRGRGRITDPTDFTPYIDPAPIALDIKSPMDLVYECFAKLGLRYICVLRDGRYAGMAHKKTFVKYVRDLEEREGHI